MPATRIADIFVGDYYQTLDPVNSPEKTAVYQSGIVTKNPALSDIANNGQGTSTISYWQDLDASEEANISTDDPDQKGKVGKASQGKGLLRFVHRISPSVICSQENYNRKRQIKCRTESFVVLAQKS